MEWSAATGRRCSSGPCWLSQAMHIMEAEWYQIDPCGVSLQDSQGGDQGLPQESTGGDRDGAAWPCRARLWAAASIPLTVGGLRSVVAQVAPSSTMQRDDCVCLHTSQPPATLERARRWPRRRRQRRPCTGLQRQGLRLPCYYCSFSELEQAFAGASARHAAAARAASPSHWEPAWFSSQAHARHAHQAGGAALAPRQQSRAAPPVRSPSAPLSLLLSPAGPCKSCRPGSGCPHACPPATAAAAAR